MAEHTPPIDQLQQRFAIPGAVHFEAGSGGLPCARLTPAAAAGVVYLDGGHLCTYQPTGQPDVLFVSERSHFEPGQPIRGGIPICFPWFAGHGDPPHGPARLQRWEVHDTATDNEGPTTHIELSTRVAPFRITARVAVGPALELTMRVEHTGTSPAEFELALHTYFAVSDARAIEIEGLDARDYLDKTRDNARFTQRGPIRIEEEVDRVYQHTPDTCTLRDPGHGRTITIEKRDAHSTIVWNPWVDKAARLSDLDDDDWQHFVCIESGNVHENAVMLEPGGVHESMTRITARPL